MKAVLSIEEAMTEEKNENIRRTVSNESRRLLDFIRKRVPSEEDAEDILQDVFFEFTETSRMMEPIEKVSAWLFTVARNKITDMFRKKKPELLGNQRSLQREDEEERLNFDDILPDSADGPDALFARKIIMGELQEALQELPEEQRDVFVMHELEDISFKEMSEQTGVAVNTLISRKRYAILYLRERLQEIYYEFITFKN